MNGRDRRCRLAAVVLGAGCIAGAGAAPASEEIRRNPFSVPAGLIEPVPDAASAAPKPARKRVRRPRFELRAVLAAGDTSLANVDGTLLAIGERHEGYRLVEVGEDGAVFERAGRRWRIALHSPATGDRR